MNRLIIVGSPRTQGRSAHLADALFEACIEDCPQDEVALVPVSTLNIEPCTGCDWCRDGGGCVEDSESGEHPARCVIEDDFSGVYELIEAADEITVVSPVYFAGPPAQLKAVLDRLQPYFWHKVRPRPKAPATLHVVGEGGDPHGYDPLIGTVRSALSCAGFALEEVYDWVGKIDENGEITAEAEVYDLEPLSSMVGTSAVSEEQDRAEGEASFDESRLAPQAASVKKEPPTGPWNATAGGKHPAGQGSNQGKHHGQSQGQNQGKRQGQSAKGRGGQGGKGGQGQGAKGGSRGGSRNANAKRKGGSRG